MIMSFTKFRLTFTSEYNLKIRGFSPSVKLTENCPMKLQKYIVIHCKKE